MEALAYLHSAVAYESDEPAPQLRSLDLTRDLQQLTLPVLTAVLLASGLTGSAIAATGVVQTDGNPLNVRSAPGGAVVGSLPNGSQIELTGRQSGGYLELANGTWVSSEWIASNASNSRTAAPAMAAATPSRPPSEPTRVVGYVRTPGEPLNIRSVPGGAVVGTLPNSTRLELTGKETNGFMERTNGTWVDKRYVAYSQPMASPAPVAAAAPSPQPAVAPAASRPAASPQPQVARPAASPASPQPQAARPAASPISLQPQTPQPAARSTSPQPAASSVARPAASSQSQPGVGTTTTTATVRTSGDPLNVRNSPDGAVISTIPNGSQVQLTGRRSGVWAERTNGTWVSTQWLAITSATPAPSQPPSASSLPAASGGPTPSTGVLKALVRTNGSPLNVRSAPEGAIIGSVPNGSQIDLTGRRSGTWAERTNGTWVATQWLSNPPTAPTTPTPGTGRPPLGTDVTVGTVRTNGSPLNVRSTPNGSIISSIANGSRVELSGRKQEGWLQLASGGWVADSWVQ